jgi:hypothetical protein
MKLFMEHLKINFKLLTKNEHNDKMALIFQGGVFTSANFKGKIKNIL